MKIEILEKIRTQDPETAERLENGIFLLWMAANWGADSHPNLWAAIAEAKRLLGIVDEDEREN